MPEVDYPIGFPDGCVISYEKKDGSLIVNFEFWNENKKFIKFKDAITVLDSMCGDVSALMFHKEDTEFLDRSMQLLYENRPARHNYIHYAFMNLDGCPCLEVVAKAVEIY